MSPSLDKRFTSPGAAIQYQAAEEVRLERALAKGSVAMMVGIKKQALARDLTAASASGAWKKVVEDAIVSMGYAVDSPEGKYLADGLLEEKLGDEAYLNAMAVIKKSAETYPAPSINEVSKALDVALDLETPSLVAVGSAIINALKRIGQTWRNRVKRAVRTGYTGMTGMVTLRVLRVANYPTKTWVTRHDPEVRETHAEVDGQSIGLDEMFIVGGSPMLFPGDRSAEYGETVNCRCVIVGSEQ
jgi:hypothetical protein